MVRETKLYDLLGASPTDSEDRLKSAYRKMALKFHPDRNKDPEAGEKFKEISEAYNVLSDPEKRSIYDERGMEGLTGGGGMGDAQDLFSHLFGGGGFFGGGSSRPAGPRKGRDLVHRVAVSLEDLFKGKTTKLALTRSRICTKCDGRGGKEGAVRPCPNCKGQGVKVTFRQIGPMVQQLQQPCNDCSGSGEVINNKDKCKHCSGKKTFQEKKILEVHIDKGMKDGQQITFPGESDEAPGAIPGDVVIVVQEKQHDRFKRQDNNLATEVDIDLLTALGGGQFVVKHLDDRILSVTIVPGEVISDGALKVIAGEGMPSHRHHQHGDLFIKLHVKFPEHIDPEKIQYLERALAPRTPLPKFEKNMHIEEATLSDLDARQQREHARGDSDAMDEDEEGPRGVQCAQQ